MPLDTIAAAALHTLLLLHSCHEHAQVIIAEPDGSYALTAPVMGESDSFRIRLKLHAGERLAAIVHTHPGCGGTADSGYFSPGDIDMANTLNIPSYIGIGTTGNVLRYIPHVTPVITLTHDIETVRSAGEFVEHVGGGQ